VSLLGDFRTHVLLAVSVLIGTAIPFVPTGEMVSGASAYAAHSKVNAVAIFLITFVCSVLGDLIMLGEFRLGARKLRPWIRRRSFGTAVAKAEQAVTKNAFHAIVTGRLIPGGRTPVLVALALARYPARRFLRYDLLACALWAAVYTTIGSIGGRVANHPIWAMAVAVAFSICLGLGINQLRRLNNWRLHRKDSLPDGPHG
jgi:membrane protein DedA with SNARE-associated domain